MSRTPPAAVARQLRQEAGFGCCACGLPILQYHHILGWAEEQHFRPQDMMVLCPMHHDQATKGAMLVDEQRRHKSNPINIREGRARGWLAVHQDYCAANFGSVLIVGDGTFLRIDGEDILGFHLDDGVLQISVRLYDRQDDLILNIEKNEWISGDPLPWDIEADWQKLTIREQARQISFSLNTKSIPIEMRGSFFRSRKRVLFDEHGILIGTSGKLSSRFAELAFVGMVF